MSWKNIRQETKQYKMRLTGTEAQWQQKLKDATNRNHEIVHEGADPYKGDLMDAGKVKNYWAVMKLPS